jgi:hypothetical protein
VEVAVAEVRFQVDDAFLEDLQKALNTKTTDIMKEALTLLSWAVKEKAKGRDIFSGDKSAGDLVRLATPGLESVKASSPS